MARNKEWAEQWNSYIKSLKGLAWIPDDRDSKRVISIVDELNEIVERNTEKEVV